MNPNIVVDCNSICGPTMVVPKQFWEDQGGGIIKRIMDDEFDYIMGRKERPAREPDKVPEPLVPSIQYADAETALRDLLESGFEHYVGMCDDLACFHCGAELRWYPHLDTCPYVAAKEFIARIDKDKE